MLANTFPSFVARETVGPMVGLETGEPVVPVGTGALVGSLMVGVPFGAVGVCPEADEVAMFFSSDVEPKLVAKTMINIKMRSIREIRHAFRFLVDIDLESKIGIAKPFGIAILGIFRPFEADFL